MVPPSVVRLAGVTTCETDDAENTGVTMIVVSMMAVVRKLANRWARIWSLLKNYGEPKLVVQ